MIFSHLKNRKMLNMIKNTAKKMTSRYIRIIIHSRITLESFMRINISILIIKEIKREKKDI